MDELVQKIAARMPAHRGLPTYALNWSVESALQYAAHRPWPLPLGPWVMKQIWHDLLFAHWPLPAEKMRDLVPAQLALDTFDGQSWVGVVPFHMSGIRAHGLPPIPGLSRFPELNVRTYVTHGGKPGVYFFSLDAANLPAVWAARGFYHLPYFHATMSAEELGGNIHYRSRRLRGAAEFRGQYRPTTEVRLREKGSIEHWFTERYCLYTTHRSQVYRGEIHHEQWPLQDAEALVETNTVAAAGGIALPASAPLLHFAHRLEVLIWPLRRAN
ncbi:MAG TPA: DUF2071 domain-containing protein [Candidatus Acidoferrum sp.]|nr:DUF2071 domain-containing protein [Candidatus Acidoferrum sp.]